MINCDRMRSLPNTFVRLMNQTLKQGCSFQKTVNARPHRGRLSIIPTPIGNMDDISPHMLRALLTADLIACEDRRVAGQLYSLIRNRNILADMNSRFGDIGLTAIVPAQDKDGKEEVDAHRFYNYSNMGEKERRKFIQKMGAEEGAAFKLEYLKYRALKVLGSKGGAKEEGDRLDQLYGIDFTDLKHIETQIMNCRKNKGRGVLIPLNTYSQTSMFDLVRALLQTKNVALVSDAGMPCISDPGWRLVDKIRNTMRDVPIEVIGGPSSAGIMVLQASLASKGGRLSGRFQGFSNLATGNFQENNQELRNLKMQEFSINFINARKLKKRLLDLQTAFSGQHRVLLANELTKKYERRFNGTISSLIQKIGEEPQFQPIGEVSYLIYPQRQPQEKTQKQEQAQDRDEEPFQGLRSANVSIGKLLQSLQKHSPQLPLKQRCGLLCATFGIKQGQARKYVYQKFST